METIQKRIDQAWRQSKDWITQFDGSPTEAFLVSAPRAAILPAIQAISENCEDLRLAAIPANQADQPVQISLDNLEDNLDQLLKGVNTEIQINYALRHPAFDLDIHAILETMDDEKLTLEIVWWADQVFSSEVDAFAQFTALAAYLIDLQNHFQAAHLLVSPEMGTQPGQEVENGVEI